MGSGSEFYHKVLDPWYSSQRINQLHHKTNFGLVLQLRTCGLSYWFLLPLATNYPTHIYILSNFSLSTDSLIKSTPLLSYGVKSLMNTVSPTPIMVTKTNKNILNVLNYWIPWTIFIETFGNVVEFLTCAWQANI